MPDNIKEFLHSWCFQSNRAYPTYISSNQGLKGKRFVCEVTVNGFNYTGYAASNDKQDAEIKAIRDLVNYMIRQNFIESHLLQEFESKKLGKDTEVTLNIEDNRSHEFNSEDNNFENHIDEIEDGKKWSLTNSEDNISQNHIDELEDSKKWSLTNAKNRLDEFMQQNKICSEYKYKSIGPLSNRKSICEITITVKKLQKILKACGSGVNKEESSEACALSLLNQLCDLGLVEPFDATQKKTKAKQVPTIKITVSEDIKQKLNGLVTVLGLQRQQKPKSDTVGKINMVENFGDIVSKSNTYHPPQIIPWSPVIENWNAWTSTTIDNNEHNSVISLDDISVQLKNMLMYKISNNEELKNIIRERNRLPIAAFKEKIVSAVYDNQIIIIKGKPGSGKSTQVPQYLMDSYILMNKGSQCNIIIVQKHRLSAILLAEKVAQERGEILGKSCGYSDRFETIYPKPYGSMLYCTPGVLLRKMELGLKGISHIIIDDIHDRDSNTDFLIILLRDMVSVYPQLKVILMSDLVDIESLQNYFAKYAIIEIDGSTCPVECYFLEDCIENLNFQVRTNSNYIDLEMEDDCDMDCNAICGDLYKPSTKLNMSKMTETTINLDLIEAILQYIDSIHPFGAVLIFLPDFNVIRMIYKHLSMHNINGSTKFNLIMLHSQAPRIDQKIIFQPCQGARKIILATYIAENSLTISDVMFVIDFCKDTVKKYTAENNVTYSTQWVSKSNLERRRGRANIFAKGYVFHLISKARFEKLKAQQVPEIYRTSLHDLLLKIKLLNLGNVKDFLSKAINKPKNDVVNKAERYLKEIHALNSNGELTALGRILARLPVDPRLGKMIIFGCILGIGDACTVIVALTLLGDPFIITNNQNSLSNRRFSLCGDRFSDHIAILNAFQKWSSVPQQQCISEEHYCITNGLNLSVLKMIKNASFQMKSILKESGFPEDCLAPQYFDYNSSSSMLNSVITLLAFGLYPNVCYYNGNHILLTTDLEPAFVHKLSVNYRDDGVLTGSPFFVFFEKIRTHPISCKQLSKVSPLQLLLFGCQKVIYENKMIIIDDWLRFDIDFELVSNILSLRPVLENLLVNICTNPEMILNPLEKAMHLITFVAQLGFPGLCNYENVESKMTKPKAEKKPVAENRKRKADQFENVVVPQKIRANEKTVQTPSSVNGPISSESCRKNTTVNPYLKKKTNTTKKGCLLPTPETEKLKHLKSNKKPVQTPSSVNGPISSESCRKNTTVNPYLKKKINTTKKGCLLPTPETEKLKHLKSKNQIIKDKPSITKKLHSKFTKNGKLASQQQDISENDLSDSDCYYEHGDSSHSSGLSRNNIRSKFDCTDALNSEAKNFNGRLFSLTSQKMFNKNLSCNPSFPINIPFNLLSNGILASHKNENSTPKTYEKSDYLNILQSESQKSIVKNSTRPSITTRPWYDKNDYENVNKSENVLDAYKNTRGFLKNSTPNILDNPLDAYDNTKGSLKNCKISNKEIDSQNPILKYELPISDQPEKMRYIFLNPRRTQNIRGRYIVAREW